MYDKRGGPQGFFHLEEYTEKGSIRYLQHPCNWRVHMCCSLTDQERVDMRACLIAWDFSKNDDEDDPTCPTDKGYVCTYRAPSSADADDDDHRGYPQIAKLLARMQPAMLSSCMPPGFVPSETAGTLITQLGTHSPSDTVTPLSL